MPTETFTLNQKELQRAAVISSCLRGDLACARAAELLATTPRHVKRLNARCRQGGEATRRERCEESTVGPRAQPLILII